MLNSVIENHWSLHFNRNILPSDLKPFFMNTAIFYSFDFEYPIILSAMHEMDTLWACETPVNYWKCAFVMRSAEWDEHVFKY